MNIKEILSYGNDIFINGLVLTILIFIGLLIAGRISKSIVRKAMKSKMNKSSKDTITAYSFTQKIIIFVINVVIVCIMLFQIRGFQQVGAAVLGASGVLAVVLGLAAQESMSNVIGGFFLSFYRPFNVGDLINLAEKNLSGVVLEIGLRHTEIRTFNNSRITIPNSIMNNAIVENKDKDNSSFCNFLFFDISYDSNIDKAISIIQKNCEAHPECIDNRKKKEKENNDPVVMVLVTRLKDFSVELRASVISKDAAIGFRMCCDLRKIIKEDFDREGIKIPFPTHTVVTKK
ncbi:MAG: mechanosensitive ion channel family protein [Anaerorhabdus sp.]